ncbi:MAG: AraC family transcriptional regulator [Muribaculaceae bacterium]|nr:AraC family transcriptional regulator [Muribaculaceae bacterium]
MILNIKNMVCPRCVMTVTAILREAGIEAVRVELGVVETAGELTREAISDLERRLLAVGFELLHDRDDALVERIKATLIDLARRDDGTNHKLSAELPSLLGAEYKHMSAVFSAHEGRTMEKYYITQKVERIKELLTYGELSVSEIAYRLGYSSVAHMSTQFKQLTGHTPTAWRTSHLSRTPLDQV